MFHTIITHSRSSIILQSSNTKTQRVAHQLNVFLLELLLDANVAKRPFWIRREIWAGLGGAVGVLKYIIVGP